MLLSIYTYVKNGIYQDYHIVDMLKHHLPLADEIVVNEGHSTDGTFEQISNLDPKIRIFRTPWREMKADKVFWHITLKDAARREAKGQWCLHLDADEFIPEWEFAPIRDYLVRATETMIPVHFVNFYGNYKVYHAHPEKVNSPPRKMILHRNIPEIEFWGDGANIRLKDTRLDWSTTPVAFTCHHFGGVRNPARLRHGWHLQAALYKPKRRWFTIPRFLFDWFPHDWFDPQFLDGLALYEGPYIRAVRENPVEFIRDNMSLYDYLMRRKSKCGSASPALDASR